MVNLLAGSEVPHARLLAHGEGPDGPWYVSERLPGRTLHEAWPTADSTARQAMIESLGSASRALPEVPVPADLLPPWLAAALAGKPWAAFHPPVVSAALQQVETARRVPGHDARLLADVAGWFQQRLALFAADEHVLVHGDLHGSNLIVDQGRVTGLIDFAEALAQPADVELDTILRWCAKAREFPPTPEEQGLDETTLTKVPGWLHGAYPEVFQREHLRERLNFYDMYGELTLYAHHPQPDAREAAQDRIARLRPQPSRRTRLVGRLRAYTESPSGAPQRAWQSRLGSAPGGQDSVKVRVQLSSAASTSSFTSVVAGMYLAGARVAYVGVDDHGCCSMVTVVPG